MMQLYPAHAADALEFDKIQQLLAEKCRTDDARRYVAGIRFHTRIEYVRRVLTETHEFASILGSSDYFPNDFTNNIQRELKLLSVSGAVLTADQLLAFLKLAYNTRDILLWFKRHQGLFPALWAIAEKTDYHGEIGQLISAVIDDTGQVRDNASRVLMQIRSDIAAKRRSGRSSGGFSSVYCASLANRDTWLIYRKGFSVADAR